MPMATTTRKTTESVAELLPRISEGNPAAWEEIVARYGTLVSATVRSFRLQDADALDAVQTTWLRLAENAHRVQFPERLGGWLTTTARRECLHILRQTTPAPHLSATTPDTVADPSAGPEQRVIDADTARTLGKLLATLSPHRRTLLRALLTDDPRPYADIARATGIPRGSIGPTRARALRQLRHTIEQHGLGPAGVPGPPGTSTTGLTGPPRRARVGTVPLRGSPRGAALQQPEPTRKRDDSCPGRRPASRKTDYTESFRVR
ncbi:MAG: RNA polymerase sigma factor [Pseudonocardiaceae bacterium]